MSRLGQIVVGIDVGGLKKGFHAVALLDGRYDSQFSSRSASDIADWCRESDACAIGVDAPCRWSVAGRARPAERELMAERIWCFSTPTEQTAVGHPKNHFGWMLNGAQLFRLLEEECPLYDGTIGTSDTRVCFETFPQAVACALSDAPVSAKRKAVIRRELLRKAGIDTAHLTNIDLVDAALCALTAYHLMSRSIKSYGDAKSGLIVVPGINRDRPS